MLLLFVFTAAMLILFAAAAGTRIVSADFLALSDGLLLFAAVSTAACTGNLSLLLSLNLFIGTQLNGKYARYRTLADCSAHFVKHIKAFHSERNNGILLTVGTQINAAL